LAALLTACAPLQSDRLLRSAEAFPKPVELATVPFFPQTEYQCGPAALATVLGWSGVETTPEALAPQVYLPAREGSLQAELLAAARRHDRVPYVLRPHLEALLSEVASDHPVLVLQNLGLSWAPKWHYAVVVGFDLSRAELVLRSGVEQRHIVPIPVFERTWARAEHWALVVLPPDKLPHSAEEGPYLEAVVALERLKRYEAAAIAYQSALKRWPKSLGAWMGLGNSRHASGDLEGAAQAFARTTELHPASAAAFNNLADSLLGLGRLEAARSAARRAVELGGPQADVYRRTLEEIERRTETSRGG
jgi:tetratricopeptide (TPR) repeat protein